MSLLPDPNDPIPFSSTREFAHGQYAQWISRTYANLMQGAEGTIDGMVYFAQQLQEAIIRDPLGTHQAMQAAGITDIDQLAFARFLQIADLPVYDKLASGCARLSAMAAARKEQP